MRACYALQPAYTNSQLGGKIAVVTWMGGKHSSKVAPGFSTGASLLGYKVVAGFHLTLLLKFHPGLLVENSLWCSSWYVSWSFSPGIVVEVAEVT